MSQNRYIEGDYNIIDDRSGMKIKRSEARFTWDGFLVHHKNWEEKQPQTDLRGRDEKIAVEDSRPRGQVKFFVPTRDDL